METNGSPNPNNCARFYFFVLFLPFFYSKLDFAGDDSAGAADSLFHSRGRQGLGCLCPLYPGTVGHGGESASVAPGIMMEAASRNGVRWGRVLGGNGAGRRQAAGCWERHHCNLQPLVPQSPLGTPHRAAGPASCLLPMPGSPLLCAPPSRVYYSFFSH